MEATFLHHAATVLQKEREMRLVADRFAHDEGAADNRAVDLATGRTVVLVITSAGGVSEQARWSIRCDALQRLHQHALARLVDFGIVGESSRFEAWSCGSPWTGSADRAQIVCEQARAFLRANGLTAPTANAVHVNGRRAVLLPDADAGYPGPIGGRAAALDTCGLTTITRPAVSMLAEMFSISHARRPQIATLLAPTGSGRTSTVHDLARIARLHGFVPVDASVAATPLAELCRGRSLFIIDNQRSDVCPHADRGWLRLLYASSGSAQPHALLLVRSEEMRGIETVALDRIDNAALVAAVRPSVEVLEPAIRRAARQAQGLPARFARLLWPGAFGDATGTSTARSAGRRAAERAAVYGHDPDVAVLIENVAAAPITPETKAWPSPGELASLRRRMAAAIADLDRGRHAPGVRQLRQAIGGLARRSDWCDAATGAVTLAEHLLRRGRPRDAQSALDAAREYAERVADSTMLLGVAILNGVACTDLAHLDEAESVLSAAAAAATAADDSVHVAMANRALARCLFWRGEYADADVTLGAPGDESDAPTVVRHLTLAARIAVGRRDIRQAMSLVATAGERAGEGDPAARAVSACTAAFVHLAVNDFDGVQNDAAAAIAAAHLAHDPLIALRARLLQAEADRRRGRTATGLAQLGRLKRLAATLPPILRSRWELLMALASDGDPDGIVRHEAAASGLGALELFAPHAIDASSAASAEPGTDDVVAILRACQNAEDETVVLKDVCGRVKQQVHAASVAFVIRHRGHMEVIATDAGHINGINCDDIALRVLDAGIVIAPHRTGDRTEGAAPVQYGGVTIGALCARWAVGSVYDLSRASAILATAAAAAAPVMSAALARQAASVPPVLTDLLGMTPLMRDLRSAIERAAAAPFPVLVTGESGSGKELVARGIHRSSGRRDRTFCTLNCAALPDDLVESELFGHARGSFTGAVTDRPGVFEEAHGGTLFLDEIGELSLRAQAKILRVIQEGELRRIGENISRRVDVRIVSATNRDLQAEVAAGRFRLDLLYRLDVIRLAVPPLRERREDIAVLAEHVWRDASARVSSRASLSAALMAALARYEWPGNVRELQNVLAALAVRTPKRGVVPPTALPAIFGARRDEQTWRLESARRTFEEGFVRAALVRSGGHRGRAAAELGVTRQGLTKLITRLGIT